MKKMLLLCFGLISLASPSLAEAPKIIDAQALDTGMGWNISVTLAHPDTGWDHFADGWDVVDAAGNSFGYRKLHHPHVEEQPFTRSLNNVMVPDGTRVVFIRVRCSKDGWKDSKYKLLLER